MLGQGAQFADQGGLAHLLETQRRDDPVDVGFLGGDQLAVDLAGRLKQTLLVVPDGIAAVQVLELRLPMGQARRQLQPEPVQMAKFARLMLCMSPVMAVGAISEVL
ncbi:hypothetical protein SAE02_73790 [Skermanella aerolata]|uniref:Uncharacterized protein n=1 Tax=Skermanella aerolata TaxID=393310 RepID=A0A512E3B9_9PROT|nr:hypothetical protein SAE02_73790 [Skermanella aerolata]